MKNNDLMLARKDKPTENLLYKSLRKVSIRIEDFIVHKTQTERRRAFFGQDPLTEVK